MVAFLDTIHLLDSSWGKSSPDSPCKICSVIARQKCEESKLQNSTQAPERPWQKKQGSQRSDLVIQLAMSTFLHVVHLATNSRYTANIQYLVLNVYQTQKDIWDLEMKKLVFPSKNSEGKVLFLFFKKRLPVARKTLKRMTTLPRAIRDMILKLGHEGCV